MVLVAPPSAVCIGEVSSAASRWCVWGGTQRANPALASAFNWSLSIKKKERTQNSEREKGGQGIEQQSCHGR